MRTSIKQLTSLQITFMVILFEIGSAPLFLLGAEARQDAWLAAAIGALAGVPLLFLFIWIQSRAPGRDFIGLLNLGFGKAAGTVFGIVYTLYFAYEAMRNVRDLGELTKLTVLPVTPMSLTMFIFVFTGAYAVWKGASVVFRLPEILLPVILFFYGMVILILFTMNVADYSRLMPVMENGIGSVMKVALPDLVSFPFGQTLVFLMFWSLWEKPGIPVKQTFTGYAFVSLFLVFVNTLIVAVLSPPIAYVSQFPMLKAVHTLSGLRFIERLEILVSILLYVGLYMKMTLFFLCSVHCWAAVTKKPAGIWTILTGLLIYGASFIEKGYAQHFAIGLGPSLKVDVFFQLAVPVVLLCCLLLKKRGRPNTPA